MRTNVKYTLTLLGLISTFAILSIILNLNFQTVYSQNPEVSYLDVNTTSSVTKFSVAAWFKTSADYKSDAFIVNKAGDGGNMNYGIWMNNAEKIQAGFETSNGKPMYATSPLSYSDGKWHYAVVTFDGSIINLYVDGIQVATKSASGSPDNGANEPVRMGANSQGPTDYFIGDVDEIRVWKSALSAQQVIDTSNGKFSTKDQIMYLDFSEPFNQTSTVNGTATNATATNATAIQVNGTATNATATNATAIQVNGTATNATAIQVNGTATNATATNESNILTKPISKNDTGNANETNENIQPIQAPQNTNDTGTTNETLGNQTSEASPLKDNNQPEAFDQSVSVDQDDQADITLVATSKDNGPLQFDITADPLQGSIDNFDKEKGTLTYVPQQGYSGNDQFKFRVIDEKGSESNVAQVDVNIKEVAQSNETQDTGLAKSKEAISNGTGTEQAANANATEQPNQPPKADGGGDQKAAVNTEVKLDGGKSSDEDGKIVSYKWEQTDGPKVDLKQSDEKTASFNVQESAAGSKLSFKLTVVDDRDASNSDDASVDVEKAQNVPPKADAGGDQKAKVGTEVKLDGGKSSDEDGKIASYKWEQTDGPKVDLKQSDEKTASFDVPDSAADSKLSFKLTVVDDKDASDSDNATVEVEKIPEDKSNPKDQSN
jgi:hypothetical protein